jgi:hypothetical protein
LKTIKCGSGDHGQRYRCQECYRRFRLKDFKKEKEYKHLWNEFVFSKQTLRELSEQFSYTKKQLQRIFEGINIKQKIHIPRAIHLVVDATYFGTEETRPWGVLVFRDQENKENLWWKFIDEEKIYHYREGMGYLISLGYTILSVTCDGFSGLPELFFPIPVQFCHFHQAQIVRRYTTQNPKVLAGHELLNLVKTLTLTTEKSFNHGLNIFIDKYRDFLNEKTINPSTGDPSYTHKKLRSAVRSLQIHLHMLFTFERFPHLKIPTTTNSLESHFSHIKDVVRIHRGLSLTLKQKMIHTILLNSSIVLKSERIE